MTDYRRNSPHATIRLEHSSSPICWEEDPCVDKWRARLWLDLQDRTTEQMPPVVLATASLVGLDTHLCDGLSESLNYMSPDLGIIGSAIDKSSTKLSNWGIAEGMNSRILIAADVVVDKYWRGLRLGPSLVFLGAALLGADAVFLSPVALPTRLSTEGVCHSDYYMRRDGAVAQRRVESSWRRAGFRRLRDGVVWAENSDDKAAAARKCVTELETVAMTAHARAWWRRRSQRRAAAMGSV